MLNVVCVLKSGGDFDKDYVFALKEGVSKNLTLPHRFTCFTDTPIRGVHNRLLTENLDGWFSKFEVFFQLGPSIYFDLDTVVVGSLEDLASLVVESYDKFFMLEAFTVRRPWASGIMAWSGEWNWLVTYCKRYAGLYSTDQECINKALSDHGKTPGTIVRKDHGIYSYKHHCKEGLLEDAKVVCFHGKPRPKDVRESWVKV
jgi:hypothetical protein